MKVRSKKNDLGGGGEVQVGRGLWAELAALLLLTLTAFFFVSIYSEHRVAVTVAGAGAPPLSNACGWAGQALAGILIAYLGLIGSYVLVCVFASWAMCAFFRIGIVGWPWRIIGALLLVANVAALEFCFYGESPLLPATYRTAFEDPFRSGGYWGQLIGFAMSQYFGSTGTYLVAGLCILSGICLVADVRMTPLVRLMVLAGRDAAVDVQRRVPGFWGSLRGAWRRRAAERRARARFKERNAPRESAERAEKKAEPVRASASASRDIDIDADTDMDDIDEVASRPRAKGRSRGKARGTTAGAVNEDFDRDEADDSEDVNEDVDEADDEEGAERDGEADVDETAAAAVIAPAAPRAPVERKIRLSSKPAEPDGGAMRFEETQLRLAGVYSLPPITFLEDPPAVNHEEGRDELEEVAAKIEKTLLSFKIEARVEEIQRGPVITQYEVSIAAGIKVHKIVSLADDMAMALSARSIRVVAPIPGKSAVGIEVPNRKRELVGLKELMQSKAFADSQAQLPLVLGKDVAGEPIIADLTRMPHLLIAGSTGSGKSVCINTIIISMLMTRTPEELKLVLIDPKMVELSSFEDIPHLLTPVITDMKKAPAALEWLVRKMEQRYALLANAEVRNIQGYNQLDKKTIFERLAPRIGHEEAEKAPEKLPYLVVIIDELADMMMSSSKEVESSIIRLAQKSRAVGIHVILATQRPSVDVITGLIKSNMPCRISFMVASRIDSRTILDRNGAERLLGQGDMLYMAPGSSDVIRAQSTFVSDKEIRKIVRFLQKETKPEFSKEIEGFLDGGGEPRQEMEPGEDDDLYEDAVRVILETQRGSASLLQRRLGVGYTRASRLMDLMQTQGLVGPYRGSKARDVYQSLEEWEAAQSASE
ncbi:MAG: DNA translocase FtsK 4TM domain-containing protein [Planctomycetota bacterium]